MTVVLCEQLSQLLLDECSYNGVRWKKYEHTGIEILQIQVCFLFFNLTPLIPHQQVKTKTATRFAEYLLKTLSVLFNSIRPSFSFEYLITDFIDSQGVSERVDIGTSLIHVCDIVTTTQTTAVLLSL